MSDFVQAVDIAVMRAARIVNRLSFQEWLKLVEPLDVLLKRLLPALALVQLKSGSSSPDTRRSLRAASTSATDQALTPCLLYLICNVLVFIDA